MWRYALPGVAIVGVLIALFAGAPRLPAGSKAPSGSPTVRPISDRTPAAPAPAPALQAPNPAPQGTADNTPAPPQLPPPPDLAAAAKAAAEASQALAAVKREREAEQALIAKQNAPPPAPANPPSPQTAPATPAPDAERQARLQELDQQIAQRNQQIAQRNETLAALNRSVDQARQALAGLQQQQAAESAVLTKLKTDEEPALTAQRDKLQSQVGDLTAQVAQQAKALDNTRADISQAQQKFAALQKQQADAADAERATTPSSVAKAKSPAAPVAGSGFSVVQGMVEKLRRQAARHAAPAPPPPPPMADAPELRVQRPPERVAQSPWSRLMAARQAIAGGDLTQARGLLESAQTQLVFRPGPGEAYSTDAGGFAAAQLAKALSLLDAGAPVPAMHYLDLAIANLGGMPQAAALQAGQP